MENKRVPEIRFEGFSGEWEGDKLGNLAKFSKGRGYAKKDLVSEGYPIILYGRLYTKYETEIQGVDTFVPKNENSVLSDGGEVIVPSSGETSEDIARASVVAESGIILGGDLNIIRPQSTIDSVFLALTVSNGRRQNEMIKRAQGKSVVHLYNSDLKGISLAFPTRTEQIKIGDFFKRLDSKIAIQEQKITTLKQTKQGFLQKMFPKEGETVPEIRFSGFSGEWKKSKLGEIADIFDGTHQTPKYTDFGVKFVSVENISDLETKKYISKEAYDKEYSRKQAEKGDVLMTRIGDIGTSKVIETDQPLAYYVTLSLLKPKNVDSRFLGWVIASPKVQSNIWRRTLHIAFPKKINLGEINQVTLMLPSIEEQTKIGNFFKQLDDTITLHEQELEALKQTKKAFLQKMFV